MKTFRKQHIYRQGNRLLGTINASNLECIDCLFDNCVFGRNRSLMSRARDNISDSKFVRSEVVGCQVGPGIIRRCEFDGLDGELFCWGTVFDQVVLRGRIAFLLMHGLNRSWDTSSKHEIEHRAFRQKFYESVDWALDISKAECYDFSIGTGAVPVHLIRRDPETQFLVTTKQRKLSEEYIQGLSVSAITKAHLKLMLQEKQEETILVAPKLDVPVARDVIRDARTLQQEGLIEQA